MTFDLATMVQGLSAPGMDSRQWISFGVVDPETDSQKSVDFTDEYGPLVSVTLQPSGIPARCRVAHEVAGNGEGEWFPFIDGDEVIVLIPEGDETAGCTIIGRLNQEIDKWPTMVAGQDATRNNFAFRRLRTPYIVETAASYLIRSASTGAFIGINQSGAVTIGNADNGFLAMNSTFMGLQNGDADVLLQINAEQKQVVLEAVGTKLVLDGQLSNLYTKGVVQIGTSGNPASEHATSIESLVIFFNAFLVALGTAIPGPLTGAGVAAAAIPALNAALAGVSLLTLVPFQAALAAALSVTKVPGTNPGVGTPGFLIG